MTGETVASRSCSFPILMGWWSEKYNNFKEVLIAANRER
jgi:hypothetical protein